MPWEVPLVTAADGRHRASREPAARLKWSARWISQRPLITTPHERPALFRSLCPRQGRRATRLHPRRPQRAAGRCRQHHRGHAHPRLGALHPDGAEGRRRGDGHLAPGPSDRGRIQARGFAGAGGAAPGRTARARGAAGARLGRRRRRSQPGQVVLLENCRVNKGEKKNDPELAQKMAALCDIFVHDAFGTAHRAEASTYGIAQYAKIACAGPLLAAEIDAITKALAHPKRPLVAIVAGSKVSTKLTILKALAAQRRPADRRRRHRQHLHAGRRPEDRQVAGRGRSGGRSARRDRGDEGARRRGADPDRRGHRQDLRRRRAGHRQGRDARWPTTT